MTDEEREDLLHRINQEGFDYCFMSYSAFRDIKDERFHQLREEYQKAHAKLFTYIDLGIDLDNL